ncbi:hypothetical protein [Pseudogracilibacillus sp. SO30301A]|uniref:hypothetical protein n=1 Tax=Pseudogracilibacillus sp. SO30301A TaxID=3098291 RepID=UPI00300DC36C
MSKLTEKDFIDIRKEINNGRLSPGNMRVGLGTFMFFSALAIGVAFAVAASASSVIGWENLSGFWQTVFKLQLILFLLQIILVFFVRGKSGWSHVLLSISYVFYTYKMVLDIYVTLSMFAMNDGVYEELSPIILIVIIGGFAFHFYLVYRSLKNKKVEANKENEKGKSGRLIYVSLPIIFFLVSITGYIFKNEILGEYEILFGLGICTFLFVAVLIGAVEFVKAAYCVIRFPSFRVNPPSPKKKNA